MNDRVIYRRALLWVLFALCLSSLVPVRAQDEAQYHFAIGKVLSATRPEYDETVDGLGVANYTQKVVLLILSGEREGETVEIRHDILEGSPYAFAVKAGDKVSLAISGHDVHIEDFHRTGMLQWLFAAFLVLVVFFGRKKGIRSVISLIVTMALVAFYLLPGIVKGRDPVWLSLVVAVLSLGFTITMIQGFSRKSLAAILGSTLGVGAAASIAIFLGGRAKLTGFSPDLIQSLSNFGETLDFPKVFFASVMMGTLGAVMDVAVSISASIREIRLASPGMTRIELFRSGMNVGHDIMGTMTNTLILAYTGSAMPLILVFLIGTYHPLKMLNMDAVASDVVRSLAGSIGLVLTIPLTAFFAALLESRGRSGTNAGASDV